MLDMKRCGILYGELKTKKFAHFHPFADVTNFSFIGLREKQSGMGEAWTGDRWRKKQKKIYAQIPTTNTNITHIVALGSRSMISSGGAQMRRMKQQSPDCKVHCISNTLFSKDVKGWLMWVVVSRQ